MVTLYVNLLKFVENYEMIRNRLKFQIVVVMYLPISHIGKNIK